MITLRRAELRDCRTIFNWRNHPEVRRHFFDPRRLSYEEHEKWFKSSLEKKDRFIFLAYRGDHAVGVLRFDILDEMPGTAEVDIYVAPDYQGRGLGKSILHEGERWVKKSGNIQKLVAKVKDENEASLRMFRACGFSVKYVLFEKLLIEEGEVHHLGP